MRISKINASYEYHPDANSNLNQVMHSVVNCDKVSSDLAVLIPEIRQLAFMPGGLGLAFRIEIALVIL